MTEDPRCCGSGTCIIDPAGRCWCGQQWDGDKMCFPSQTTSSADGDPGSEDETDSSVRNERDAE